MVPIIGPSPAQRTAWRPGCPGLRRIYNRRCPLLCRRGKAWFLRGRQPKALAKNFNLSHEFPRMHANLSARHDQFRLRARALEEPEENSVDTVNSLIRIQG